MIAEFDLVYQIFFSLLTSILFLICIFNQNRIVETMSRALLNQEKRNRYVSRQVALMLRLQEESLQATYNQQLSSSSSLQYQNNFLLGNNNIVNENNNISLKKNTTLVTNNSNNDNNSNIKKKIFKPIENSSGSTSSNSTSLPSQISDLNLNLNLNLNSNLNSKNNLNFNPHVPTPPLSSRIAPNNDVNNNDSNSNIVSSVTSSPCIGSIYPKGSWALSPQRDTSPPTIISTDTINSGGTTGMHSSHNLISYANSMTSPLYVIAPDGETVLSHTISNTTTIANSTMSHNNNNSNISNNSSSNNNINNSNNNSNNNILINNNNNNSNSSSVITGAVNNTTTYESSNIQRRPIFDKKLEVMESMQQQSSLANELRLLYHGLIGVCFVEIVV